MVLLRDLRAWKSLSTGYSQDQGESEWVDSLDLRLPGPGWALTGLGLSPQALLPLALEGTDVGQTKAAQALAKLTITSNPEMTFPGERVCVSLFQS